MNKCLKTTTRPAGHWPWLGATLLLSLCESTWFWTEGSHDDPHLTMSKCALSHGRLRHAVVCSPPGSSVHGILQARTLEWAAVSFSRGSSRPRDRTWVSCISWNWQADCFPRAAWEVHTEDTEVPKLLGSWRWDLGRQAEKRSLDPLPHAMYRN